MKYIGYDILKLKNKIKCKSIVFLYENEILIEYKKYIEEFGIQTKFLPYLYSIKNEQNDTISNIYFSRES
jgi:hypothetical protein